jgi:hypothetical protein
MNNKMPMAVWRSAIPEIEAAARAVEHAASLGNYIFD